MIIDNIWDKTALGNTFFAKLGGWIKASTVNVLYHTFPFD